MRIKDILPSIRFTTVVGSISLAVLLVWGAYVLTHTTPKPESTVAVGGVTTSSDWKQALTDIQAQNPLNKAPQAPSQDKVDAFLQAATSDNLTDTVARTILVNLSTAKAQGLGNDIPTQKSIVADATAKINQEHVGSTFEASDLTQSDNSKTSLKTYGNAFMAAVRAHPQANYGNTLYIVATSTATANPKRLKELEPISRDYAALAEDLANIHVPVTLLPLHLKVVNDLARISETLPDMEKFYTDPLRALGGLKVFDALNLETQRLLINIAQEFRQNGILFNADEPGAAWSTLVP
jgi:hypothetical protein